MDEGKLDIKVRAVICGVLIIGIIILGIWLISRMGDAQDGGTATPTPTPEVVESDGYEGYEELLQSVISDIERYMSVGEVDKIKLSNSELAIPLAGVRGAYGQQSIVNVERQYIEGSLSSTEISKVVMRFTCRNDSSIGDVEIRFNIGSNTLNGVTTLNIYNVEMEMFTW